MGGNWSIAHDWLYLVIFILCMWLFIYVLNCGIAPTGISYIYFEPLVCHWNFFYYRVWATLPMPVMITLVEEEITFWGAQIAMRLKELNMPIADDFLVHRVLNSLLKFKQLKDLLQCSKAEIEYRWAYHYLCLGRRKDEL